jgi:hypothetical protein
MVIFNGKQTKLCTYLKKKGVFGATVNSNEFFVLKINVYFFHISLILIIFSYALGDTLLL